MKNFILLILIFCGYYLSAQKVRRYNIESGLPDVSSLSLHTDKNGLLWIGTQAGLAVYNGIEFENIPCNNDKIGTRGMIMHKIAPVSDGTMYLLDIGVKAGVFEEHLELYNPKTNKSKEINLKKKGILIDANAERWGSILVDYQDNLWLLSSKQQVVRYNNVTKDSVGFNIKNFIKDSITMQSYYGLVSDLAKNKIYFCYDKGLFCVSNKKKANKLIELKDEQISGVFGDEKGIWIFTLSGKIYWFDTATEKFTLKFTNIPGTDPNVICTVKKGNDLFIGGYSGITQLDLTTGGYKIITNNPLDKNSLSSTLVSSLAFDSENNLWAGTAQSGLNCVMFAKERFLFHEILNEIGKPVEVYQGVQESKNSWT